MGIPAAFWYFLVRQKSRINPPTDKGLKDRRGGQHVVVRVSRRDDVVFRGLCIHRARVGRSVDTAATAEVHFPTVGYFAALLPS